MENQVFWHLCLLGLWGCTGTCGGPPSPGVPEPASALASDCVPHPEPLVLGCWPRETGALVFGVGLNEGHAWQRNQLVYVRHKTSGLDDALGLVLELSSDQKRAKVEIIHIRVGSDPKLLGAAVRPLPKDQEPRLGGAVSRLGVGRNDWVRLGVGTGDGVKAKDGGQPGSRYRVVDISRDLKEVGFLEVRWVAELEAQAQWLNPPAALKDMPHWLALEVPTDYQVPQGAALRVLVLNFGATAAQHNQHGESYAAELTRALQGAVCGKDAEGKETCSIDVVHEPHEKVPPTLSDAEGHKKAKTIGEQHGAALVVWGSVKCNDKGCAQPRMTLVAREVFARGERALGEHFFELNKFNEFKGEIVDHPQRLAQALLGRVMYKAQKYGDASYYLGAAMTEPKMWAYSDLQRMRYNRAYAAYTVGQVTLAQRLSEVVIAAAAAQGDNFWQVRGLAERARVYELVGKIAAAEADLNQIRAQTQNDPRMQSYALFALGQIGQQQGRVAEAHELQEKSLDRYKSIANLAGEAATVHELGHLAEQQGRVGEAHVLYEKSLALSKSMGGVKGEAATLHNLANLALRQGRVGEAQGLYEKSLALNKSIGNVKGEAATLHGLGLLAKQQGRMEAAQELYEKSLALRESIGDVKGEAETLHQLAGSAEQQGRVAEAQGLFEKSLALFKSIGNVAGEAATLHELGHLALQQGRVAEAQGLYEKSLALKKSIGDVQGEAATSHELGRLAEQQGRVAEAHGLYEKSLALKKSVGDVKGALATQTNLMRLAYQAGQKAQAEKVLRDALAVAEARGYVYDSAFILTSLTQIKLDQGQWAAAQSLGQRAVAEFRQLQMEAEAQAVAQLVALAEGRLQLIKKYPFLAQGAAGVNEVLADGPGARVGLMAGDIIYGYDGQRVTSAADLMVLGEKMPTEAKVTLELVRGAERLILQVSGGKLMVRLGNLPPTAEP